MIADKAECLRLLYAGRLGNYMPHWMGVAELLAARYPGTVTIRDRVRDSPFMRHGVAACDVLPLLKEWGVDPGRFYFVPTYDDGRTLQGEATEGTGGLYLNYTRTGGNLRHALDRDGRHAERSAARAILRAYLCPNSLDDLDAVMAEHPGCAVEFTCFDRHVGAIPGRNTVFWEVRNY